MVKLKIDYYLEIVICILIYLTLSKLLFLLKLFLLIHSEIARIFEKFLILLFILQIKQLKNVFNLKTQHIKLFIVYFCFQNKFNQKCLNYNNPNLLIIININSFKKCQPIKNNHKSLSSSIQMKMICINANQYNFRRLYVFSKQKKITVTINIKWSMMILF